MKNLKIQINLLMSSYEFVKTKSNCRIMQPAGVQSKLARLNPGFAISGDNPRVETASSTAPQIKFLAPKQSVGFMITRPT